MVLFGLMALQMTSCSIIYTARYQKGNKHIKEIGLFDCPKVHTGIPIYRDIEQVNEDNLPDVME